MKKLSQFLKSHILETLEVISLKFGMWSAEVGGHVHSKNRHFIKEAQSYGGAKIAFSFFLSLYSRVLRAGFLGRNPMQYFLSIPSFHFVNSKRHGQYD